MQPTLRHELMCAPLEFLLDVSLCVTMVRPAALQAACTHLNAACHDITGASALAWKVRTTAHVTRAYRVMAEGLHGQLATLEDAALSQPLHGLLDHGPVKVVMGACFS